MSFQDGFKVTMLKEFLLGINEQGKIFCQFTKSASKKKYFIHILGYKKKRLDKKILFLNLIRKSSAKTMNHCLPYWMTHVP